ERARRLSTVLRRRTARAGDGVAASRQRRRGGGDDGRDRSGARLGPRAPGRRAARRQHRRGRFAGARMSIPLERVALRAMVDNGFQPEPPASARRELAALPDTPRDGVRDLRQLRWSSIDNVTSKDLDQIEVAESMPDGAIRLRIGIADVDALVPKGSAIDAHAAENSTSVYTGISVFPMLPDALSTDRTSLLEGGERIVVVTELEIGADGALGRTALSRALAVNHAKLDYESVGAWLEGHGPQPDKIAADDSLEAQLWLQD